MRVPTGPALWIAFCVLIAGAVSGCAPVTRPAGPATTMPALEADEVVAKDGTRLPLLAWLPENGSPKAVVVAVHGFNDYSRFFDMPARYLARNGVASFAYDQRGFGATEDSGKWAGTETLADDLGTVVALVHRRYPGAPIYLLGNSMGAAVTIVALTAAPAPPVAGVILSAPALWGWRTQPWHQRLALWISAHTVPWLTVSGRGLGIRPSDNNEMLRALSSDPLVIKKTRIDAIYGLVTLMDRASDAARGLEVPSLILYGANDQLIPPEPLQRFLLALPVARNGSTARFAYYESGFHMLLRDLQGEVVWRDVLTWIDDPSKPLPSSADRYAVEAGACPASAVCAIVPPARTRSSAG